MEEKSSVGGNVHYFFFGINIANRNFSSCAVGLSTGRVGSGSGRRPGFGRVKNTKPPQPPPTVCGLRVVGFGFSGLQSVSVGSIGFSSNRQNPDSREEKNRNHNHPKS